MSAVGQQQVKYKQGFYYRHNDAKQKNEEKRPVIGRFPQRLQRTEDAPVFIKKADINYKVSVNIYMKHIFYPPKTQQNKRYHV